MDVLPLIRRRVRWCEEQRVEILCCPEAILGGLADYAKRPYLGRDLFVTECDKWIHLRCSARGQVTRQQSHEQH
jgi:hypothetical protein